MWGRAQTVDEQRAAFEASLDAALHATELTCTGLSQSVLNSLEAIIFAAPNPPAKLIIDAVAVFEESLRELANEAAPAEGYVPDAGAAD